MPSLGSGSTVRPWHIPAARPSSKARLWAPGPAWPRGDWSPSQPAGDSSLIPYGNVADSVVQVTKGLKEDPVCGHVDLWAPAWPRACWPHLARYKPLITSRAFIFAPPHVAAAAGETEAQSGVQHGYNKVGGVSPLRSVLCSPCTVPALGREQGAGQALHTAGPFASRCAQCQSSCSPSAITHKAFCFLHLEGSCFLCGVTGGAGLTGHPTACSLAPWSRVAGEGSPCAGSDAGEVL